VPFLLSFAEFCCSIWCGLLVSDDYYQLQQYAIMFIFARVCHGAMDRYIWCGLLVNDAYNRLQQYATILFLVARICHGVINREDLIWIFLLRSSSKVKINMHALWETTLAYM
jgi:hypothetical protein